MSNENFAHSFYFFDIRSLLPQTLVLRRTLKNTEANFVLLARLTLSNQLSLVVKSNKLVFTRLLADLLLFL